MLGGWAVVSQVEDGLSERNSSFSRIFCSLVKKWDLTSRVASYLQIRANRQRMERDPLQYGVVS